jgi:D-aminopeptidase
MLAPDRIDPLYAAVVDAVEESILNALLAAETTTGRNGNTAHALPHDLLTSAMRLF